MVLNPSVNVFVLTAFEYSYLAFTSLVIVVELCTLLCYEVITGAQRKAGTGHKMQTLSVVFSTLHC